MADDQNANKGVHDDAALTGDQVKLDNAPTDTTNGEAIQTSAATHIETGNLASNVVSKTTNDTEQSTEDTVEESKALGLHNHAVEHADDPVSKTGDKTAV
jgi:hypothetical protein